MCYSFVQFLIKVAQLEVKSLCLVMSARCLFIIKLVPFKLVTLDIMSVANELGNCTSVHGGTSGGAVRALEGAASMALW